MVQDAKKSGRRAVRLASPKLPEFARTDGSFPKRRERPEPARNSRTQGAALRHDTPPKACRALHDGGCIEMLSFHRRSAELLEFFARERAAFREIVSCRKTQKEFRHRRCGNFRMPKNARRCGHRGKAASSCRRVNREGGACLRLRTRDLRRALASDLRICFFVSKRSSARALHKISKCSSAFWRELPSNEAPKGAKGNWLWLSCGWTGALTSPCPSRRCKGKLALFVLRADKLRPSCGWTAFPRWEIRCVARRLRRLCLFVKKSSRPLNFLHA